MYRGAEKSMVFVADDLGRSLSVNQAITHAHDHGVLTAASLMAGGDAFENAVQIARGRSSLSTGVHVTLCDGKAVLSRSHIPDLVDTHGQFEADPSRAWVKYHKPSLKRQLESEIRAQFDRIEAAGIQPTHVDGHHHLHMHPIIFGIVCRSAMKKNIQWIRIPREPLQSVLRFRSKPRGVLPFAEWLVFRILGTLHIPRLSRYGMRAADRVYGLARSGQVDEPYVLASIARCGTFTELFCHPDLASDAGRREMDALQSPTVRKTLSIHGISLVGYRELIQPEVPGGLPERL